MARVFLNSLLFLFNLSDHQLGKDWSLVRDPVPLGSVHCVPQTPFKLLFGIPTMPLSAHLFPPLLSLSDPKNLSHIMPSYLRQKLEAAQIGQWFATGSWVMLLLILAIR